MIIYSNEGNPFGLNLIVCARLTLKDDVTVKFVNFNDPALKGVKQLPTLELDSGEQIFSPVAAAKYLWPCEDNNVDVWNYWLEWSTTRLAPALVQTAGNKADPNAKLLLNQLIKHLNDTLSKSLYITGAKLSAADISIWSLLAPGHKDKSPKTLEGFQDIDSLLIWHKNISLMFPVQAAVEIFPQNDLLSLQQSNRCLDNIVLIPQMENEANLSPTDSPTHVVDVVTQDELKLAAKSFIYTKQAEVKEPRTILPVANRRNVLITSALPYVNNVPHLGNIIGCVLSADIFARYSRIAGYNTLFICGTDEYGTATETKALAEKLTPQQICDKYFEIHNNIYRWFGIGFDYFGRTTTPEQTEITQSMFLDLHKNGHLFTQSVDQLQCRKCNRFLADRFVEGICPHIGCGYEDARGDQCDGCGKLVNATDLIKPRCITCSDTPIVVQSSQFFLDLPKIEPKLRTWFNSVEAGWSNNARVITKAWLKEGLKPRCITRDLKWGVPVPYKGYESKVFYVWFDAPIGYLSITNKYTKEWRQWWQPTDKKVELFQFMAKDNVPFHSVMFPSSLLALDQGYTIVSHIMATEYLNYEDGKFSKSRGIGVFGNDAQDTGIPADVWRFYLAAARPEAQDSSFSWNDLIARNNSELLNNLGNFINRSLVFCEKNFDSTVQAITLQEDELNLLALINREIKGYVQSMEKAKFRNGIHHILSISRHGNQYMQSQQPWVLLKGSDSEKARAGTVISLSCNIVCLLANLMFPFMPSTSRNIYTQLNVVQRSVHPEHPQMEQFLEVNHKIGKPVPLFVKIDQAKLDELKKKYGGQQTENNQAAAKPAEKIVVTTVEEAEKAVAEQGEKVRVLKASGVEKALWQPEVAILLSLKKQLTALQASAPTSNGPSSKVDLKDIEENIAKQGEKLRLLKLTTKDKALLQPEIDELLRLKKHFTDLGGIVQAPATQSSSKNKKKK